MGWHFGCKMMIHLWSVGGRTGGRGGVLVSTGHCSSVCVGFGYIRSFPVAIEVQNVSGPSGFMCLKTIYILYLYI